MNEIKNLSSCDCKNCMYRINNLKKQIPKNCNFEPELECQNRIVFKNQIEPMNKGGFIYINPESYTNFIPDDFRKIKNTGKDGCPKELYTSSDPRLISSYHNGQKTLLDYPTSDGSIKLKDIYTDPTNKYYKNLYKNYEDIKSGQIMYYIDNDRSNTLILPVFANAADVSGEIYKDPMGSAYPEYMRMPIKNNNVLNTKNRKYSYCLSSIDDENEFREDIIHLQMRPQDRKRYSPRWTGNLSY